MPYIEDLAEFKARQGGDALVVQGRYLFPNGAQSDGVTHTEPPANKLALARLKYQFGQAKLDAAITRYNQEAQAIATQAEYHRMGAGPLPAPGWEQHLKELADEIESLQNDVDRLQSLIKSLVAPAMRHDQRSIDRSAANAVVQKLQELPSF